MTDRHVETHTLEWNGIRIEIRYCPSWSESYERIYGYPLAHLEIEAIDPARTPLPVTETGYRSLFTRADLIEEMQKPERSEGAFCRDEPGPVAFARAWLDEAAKDPKWIEREAARKQLSLF